MKRTLMIETEVPGVISCAVVLDSRPVNGAADEQESRKHMAKITVEPWYYQEFVQELVAAGWFMSEGAKLNFSHQIRQL